MRLSEMGPELVRAIGIGKLACGMGFEACRVAGTVVLEAVKRLLIVIGAGTVIVFAYHTAQDHGWIGAGADSASTEQEAQPERASTPADNAETDADNTDDSAAENKRRKPAVASSVERRLRESLRREEASKK